MLQVNEFIFALKFWEQRSSLLILIQVWEMCQILNVRCKSLLMSRVGELLSNFSLLSRINYMLPRELWGLTVISAICDFCNFEDHLPRAGAVKFERPTITESGAKDA